MSEKYRPGVKDSRERYSNRVDLLIECERFFVVEFDEFGSPVGKDEFGSLNAAIDCFNILVALIEREDHVTVMPVYY